MKKFGMIAIGLLVWACGMSVKANPCTMVGDTISRDTIIVVKSPRKVTIEKGKNRLGVRVEGSEDNPNFQYVQNMEVGDDALVVTEEKNSDWDFHIPFVNKKEKKWSSRFELTSGGLGIGLVTGVNAAQGVDIDMGASYELMWDHILNFSHYLSPNKTSVSLGLGITWRNYRMTGQTRFVKEDGEISLTDYPDGADIQFSRIKVFSLTMPFMLNQRLTNKLRLSVGPVVNFNTHASLKTRYKLDGEKVKDKAGNIHQNKVTIDFMAHLKFRGLGVYVKYSPSNVLHKEFGPEFRSLSTGITVFH